MDPSSNIGTSITIVVDKKKNRVVFAECGKDFVDILFSFLTLPMGTVVRLLDNNSGVGCFDKLYESVKILDNDYLQTKACKTMLLQPRSAAETHCGDLKININDLEPRRTYRCQSNGCLSTTYSSIPDTLCVSCEKVMDKKTERVYLGRGQEGDCVFLKGAARFMITDDLHVKPLSTDATLFVFERLGIKDANSLMNSVVNAGKTEILSLLKAALKGKSPLTDVFLKSSYSIGEDNNILKEFEPIDTYPVKVEGNVAKGSKALSARLLISKATNKVAYIETGGDLVDQLLSFLTFPLGAIVKLLNKHSSLCCVDNLYHSVDVLSDDYVKSVECKEMLLSPKLATHFGCSNQLLTIDEKGTIIAEINPKLPVTGTMQGGGFAKKFVTFMVTNEMKLSPLSTVIGIDVMKELRIPITGLVKREIAFGEAEVLNLLKVCLTSRAEGLNNIFYTKNRISRFQFP